MIVAQSTAGQWTAAANICPYGIPSDWPWQVEPSVGSGDDSYDNALAETINRLYKAEVIHRLGPWKTMAAVEWETLKWVDWFNNLRLLAPIGYIPPAEAEEWYYAQHSTLDMLA